VAAPSRSFEAAEGLIPSLETKQHYPHKCFLFISSRFGVRLESGKERELVRLSEE
jgi:hypothetical protein